MFLINKFVLVHFFVINPLPENDAHAKNKKATSNFFICILNSEGILINTELFELIFYPNTGAFFKGVIYKL